MRTLQKTVTSLIIASFLLLPFGNVVTAAEEIYVSQNKADMAQEAMNQRNAPDWRNMNWDSEVVLPSDREKYFKEVAELKDHGRGDEIPSIKMRTVRLGDEEVLDYFNVPSDVRDSIQDRQSSPITNPAATTNRDENLTIDINSGTPISIDNLDRQDERPPVLREDFEKSSVERHPLYDATNEGLNLKNRNEISLFEMTKNVVFYMWSKFVTFVSPETAYAEFANPLIKFYDGIEYNAMDSILYYLSLEQNADGSFGTYNNYELTAEIALLLAKYNRTNNDQFALMVDYLKSATPKNNREKAIKMRLMAGLGEDYVTLRDELAGSQNIDGGFGLFDNYSSDVQTTLEVFLAFLAADYSINDKFSKAVVFVLNNIDENGAMYYTNSSGSSYFLVNKTLEYLYAIKDFVFTTANGTLSVQSKINSLLSFLSGSYDAATESLSGADRIIDELLTTYSFQLYGVNQTARDALLKKCRSRQNYDGSFENSLYSTIAGMKALPQADLQIVSIENNGSLMNNTPASLKIKIKNNGYASVSNATLYQFIDKIKWNAEYDFAEAGITIDPFGTFTLIMDYSCTRQFIGDTLFTFYIENGDEFNYEDNWAEKTFSFSAANNGIPALPMFYIAQKDESGEPRINVRWAHKEDPNRSYYAVLIREAGTTQWYRYYISNTYPGSGLFFSGFVEGKTYEVGVGAVYKNEETVALLPDTTNVKVSLDPNAYTGNVSGFLTVDDEPTAGVSTFGYNVSAKSDETGNFLYANAPNGTDISYVNTPYYEDLWTRFSVDVGKETTGVRLFTRLKPDTEKPIISYGVIGNGGAYAFKNQHKVTIWALGSDNVGIKGADFYYWDPSDESWNYLGTKNFPAGQNYIDMDWYIPEALMGEGYKLKTVFFDYQNNISEPKEWGPFTIIDSDAPKTELELLSPSGGEQLELGKTYDVKWETTVVSGVTIPKVKLYFISKSGGSVIIASNISNSGLYKWTVPMESNYAGENLKIKVCSYYEIDYEYVCDESDDYFSMVDNSPQPDFPWGSVEILTNSGSYMYSPAGGYFDKPQIAYDSLGNAHVIYRYVSDNFGEPRVITEQLYHVIRGVDGAWSVPEKIYEKIWETDSQLNGFMGIMNLQMKMDNASNFHIVWENLPYNNSCVGYNTQDIFYLASDGKNWLPVKNVSANLTESRSPSFAMGGDNTVYIAWIDGTASIDNGECASVGQRGIYFRKKVGNVWSELPSLTPDPYLYDPLVAVTGNNVLNLVYQSGQISKIAYTKYAGSWSAPIYFFDGYSDSSDLSADTGGSLHYAFRHVYKDPNVGNRSRILYASFAANNWTNAVEVSPISSGYSAERPSIISSFGGVPYIAFSSVYNGWQDLVVVNKNADGSWGPIQKANRVSQEVDTENYDISYGSLNKKLAMIWLGYFNFSRHVHFNEADLKPLFSTFNKLNIYNPVVYANNLDTQTVDLVVNNAKNVDQVDLIVNYPFLGSTNDYRGHFTWTPSSCDIYYAQGSQYVSNLVCSKSSEPESDTATFTFTWTLNSNYGSIEKNVISYYWKESTTGFIQSWQHVKDQPFDVISGVNLSDANVTVYEDAEDGKTLGWKTFYTTDSVASVYENSKQGNVIVLKNSSLGSTSKFFKDDGTDWNDSTNKFFSLDLNSKNSFQFVLAIETNIGPRFLGYNNTIAKNTISGNYFFIKIDQKFADGTWKTISRDLQADLNSISPGTVLNKVNSFQIWWKGLSDNVKIDNIKLSKSLDGNGTVYEDATDGQTLGWKTTKTSDVITNVYEEAKQSNVIVLKNPTLAGYFKFYKDDGTDWNDSTNKFLSLDLNSKNSFQFVLAVETNIGPRFLGYNNTIAKNTISGNYFFIKIDQKFADGTWKTISRDLQADLTSISPGTVLNKVNSFQIWWKGLSDNVKIDNIKLTKSLDSVYEVYEDAEEIVYEDAEDGKILGWKTTKTSDVVTNVYEEAKKSNVIVLKNPTLAGYFKFYKDDGTDWNNSVNKFLSLDLNSKNSFQFVLAVETNIGSKYIGYNNTIIKSMISGDYFFIKIDQKFADGTWKTISRDLQADLTSLSPGTILNKVNSFQIWWKGSSDNVKIDNIKLSKSLTPPVSPPVAP